MPVVRIGILTREYPPDVYGGAGVHVDFLVRELSSLPTSTCTAWASRAPGATAHSEHDPLLEGANAALRTLAADLSMANTTAGVRHRPFAHVVRQHGRALGEADVRHPARRDVALARTAAAVEGRAARRRLPRVVMGRAHRLRGGRGGDRRQPRFAARRAAVVPEPRRGEGPRRAQRDRHRVLQARPGDRRARPARRRPRPAVGRVRRPHHPAEGRARTCCGPRSQFDPSAQLVLLAGAADTPELAAETDAAVATLRANRDAVFLVSEMLPREEVRQVLTHGTVFVCPSVYEPLGIVNLEAMACETAVVASDVGGIPEVVDDGETGLLVHYQADDPERLRSRPRRRRQRTVPRSRRGRRRWDWPDASGPSNSSAGTPPPERRCAIYESVL